MCVECAHRCVVVALQVGAGLTTAAAHLTNLRNAQGDVLLNGKDLDPHNKQHWPGVIKMFSFTVSDALKARIDGPGKEVHFEWVSNLQVISMVHLKPS